MVPVWGWGALLCVVLKAHHSPTQSLHRCSARSRGDRGNRTGLPALCSTVAGLMLTGIMADSHHTCEEERNEKEMEAENGEIGWISSVLLLIRQTNAGSLNKKTPTLSGWSEVRLTLCSGWCNGGLTWTDVPEWYRFLNAKLFFAVLTGCLYSIWTPHESLLWIPVAATALVAR